MCYIHIVLHFAHVLHTFDKTHSPRRVLPHNINANCKVRLALSDVELPKRDKHFKCAIALPAQAWAKAVTPASPIWLLHSQELIFVCDSSSDCNATRFASSNQLRVELMLAVNHNLLERCQCPTGAGVGQSRHAGVADLVAAEVELLRMAHMAHQTKLSDQENTHAKAQGMRPRQ